MSAPERIWMSGVKTPPYVGAWSTDRSRVEFVGDAPPVEYIRADLAGWQPIETAPRDGAWVLLAGGVCHECTDIEGWPDGRDVSEADLKRPVVASWHDDWGWRYAFWESGWRNHYVAPTHWMPLPAPPQETNP